MDWNFAIEKNREALKSVLVMLVAIIAGNSGAATVDGSTTLPRHLHRFVLRLLRPAESATRRLIIVAARGMVVKIRPWRPRKLKPNAKPLLNRANGYGTNIVIRPGPLPEWAKALMPKRSPNRSLPLLDPFKRFAVRRAWKRVPEAQMPRIRVLGGDDGFNPYFHRPSAPAPAPPKPTPDDPLDATRLARRLEAIGRVLDDLPKAAQRMARWQARRDATLAQRRELEAAGVQFGSIEVRRDTTGARKVRVPRLYPMRPGHPPGWRRKPDHDVYEVLNVVHGLAAWARERSDTS